MRRSSSKRERGGKEGRRLSRSSIRGPARIRAQVEDAIVELRSELGTRVTTIITRANALSTQVTSAVTNTPIGTPPGVVAGHLAGPSPIKAGQAIMLKLDAATEADLSIHARTADVVVDAIRVVAATFANVLNARTTAQVLHTQSGVNLDVPRVYAIHTVRVELGTVLLTRVATSPIASTVVPPPGVEEHPIADQNSFRPGRIVARAPRMFADALTAGVDAVSPVRAWRVMPVLVNKGNALSEEAIS